MLLCDVAILLPVGHVNITEEGLIGCRVSVVKVTTFLEGTLSEPSLFAIDLAVFVLVEDVEDSVNLGRVGILKFDCEAGAGHKRD